MSITRSFTRRRANTGSLGLVRRSIGYLQGGYKGGTIHSKVQLFNTNTQVGTIVYDSGYPRYYQPGITGNFAGYFSINANTDYSKFNYITVVAALSFSTPGRYPETTVVDLGIFSRSWLVCGNGAVYAGDVTDFIELDLVTDTPTSRGIIATAIYLTSRQGLNTSQFGFFTDGGYSITSLNFVNRTAVVAGPTLASTGLPTGMSVDDSNGYIVGNNNVKLSIVGGTIAASEVGTPYTYQFSESHSLTSSTRGYMMAGYADTTGRFDNAQHGLCQKITFSNQAITTLPDLALPQSSGQMMQGF